MPDTPEKIVWLSHPTWRAGLMLALLCLLVYLPGFFSLPPVDRDESRFAQASRQMFESVALPEGERDPVLHGGGLVVPRVQGRDRLTKPPLIYWLQVGSAATFTGGDPLRDAIWMYRVPSLLAGIIAVLATWRLGVSMFGPAVGFLSGALLAVCPVIVWEAHQARADMVLLACTTVTMLALWHVYQRRDRKGAWVPRRSAAALAWLWPLVFWIALSLGVMTKGPITPMIALLTALSLSLAHRDFRWLLALRPFVGLLILGAAMGPWVYAVAARVGFDTYWRAIYDETIGRSLGTKEGHWGPPGYHTILMPVLFWPGSMLTGLGIVHAFRLALARSDQSRDREGAATSRLRALLSARAADPACLFCLAWLIPSWLVFEFVTTKLPHYTMPLLPPLAIVSAWAVCEVVSGRLIPARRMVNPGIRAWSVLTAVLGVGLPLALFGWAAGWQEVHYQLAVWAGIVAALLFSLWVPLPHTSRGWLTYQTCGIVAAVILAVAGIGITLPRTDVIWLSPRLAEAFTKVDPLGAFPLAAVQYHEDSLVFITRGRLERVNRPEAALWQRQHPNGVIVLPDDYAFVAMEVLSEVRGFNYSRGRFETYRVVRGAP